MTLSIIIVSYNVKYFLEQTLCSVQASISNTDAEVIVIDNCSTDNSIAYLHPLFPSVHFIQNEKNEGFAKANNKALQSASGKYILFLNPDTILAEDTLEQCIFFLDKHQNAGAVGVRMIDGSGTFLPESKRSFPSPMVSFYKLIGLASLYPFSKRFGKYALRFLAEKEIHKVDVLAGAFMMVCKKVLDETGGFDEQFFMYAEDIDLSYRIQKSGYQNYYLGNVTIVHFKGESTKKGSLNYVKIFYNAMSLFVRKYYRGAGAWLLRQTLEAGILAREAVSILALPIKQKKKMQNHFFKEVVLIGNNDDTKKAESIVKQHYPHADINKRTESVLSQTSFVHQPLVVFCIGGLSYKKSIAVLDQRKGIALYKWFGKNSNCMVGSDHKNSSGEALVNQ